MKKKNYDYTIKERVMNFTVRQKAKGLKLIRVWVPVEKEQCLKDIVAAMRKEKNEETEI